MTRGATWRREPFGHYITINRITPVGTCVCDFLFMPTFAVTFPTTTPHKFQPVGNRDGCLNFVHVHALVCFSSLHPSPIAQGVSIALLFLDSGDLCVMSLDSNDGHLFVALSGFWCVLFSMPFVTHTTDERNAAAAMFPQQKIQTIAMAPPPVQQVHVTSSTGRVKN